VIGGPSSANQTAGNLALGEAVNGASTGQQANATQVGGGSSCLAGCGGSGQFQAVLQGALTWQNAGANANATQNAVNGNAPVTIAGGNVIGGPSSANQTAGNIAGALSLNLGKTWQQAAATQIG
jgi:hypothetical protein